MQVGSRIDQTSEADMHQLKQIRLVGKWLVLNLKRTVVKFIGNEQDAKKFFTTQKAKRGGAFLLEPLKTIKITVAEQEKYHQIQKAIIGA